MVRTSQCLLTFHDDGECDVSGVRTFISLIVSNELGQILLVLVTARKSLHVRNDPLAVLEMAVFIIHLNSVNTVELLGRADLDLILIFTIKFYFFITYMQSSKTLLFTKIYLSEGESSSVFCPLFSLIFRTILLDHISVVT